MAFVCGTDSGAWALTDFAAAPTVPMAGMVRFFYRGRLSTTSAPA
jgi:hypothetical protein